MELRTMAAAEVDTALELWSRTDHLGAVPRDEVESLLAHHPDLVLVAVAGDGSLAGVVLGSFDGRRGWISRLAVDPAHRRRGVGAALVRELERRLAARGCTRVNLLVLDDNHDGRRVWERLGYEGTDQVVLYSRPLAASEVSGSAC